MHWSIELTWRRSGVLVATWNAKPCAGVLQLEGPPLLEQVSFACPHAVGSQEIAKAAEAALRAILTDELGALASYLVMRKLAFSATPVSKPAPEPDAPGPAPEPDHGFGDLAVALGAAILARETLAEERAPVRHLPSSPGSLRVFAERATWDALWAHGRSSPNEVMGELVGRARRDGDGPWVAITGHVKARHADATPVSATDNEQNMQTMLDERLSRYPDEEVVGWYHTHPGLGAFLSPTDLRTKAVAYPLSHQVAVVLDPILKQTLVAWGKPGKVENTPDVFVMHSVRAKGMV